MALSPFIYANTEEDKEEALPHERHEYKNWLLKNQDSPEYFNILMQYYIIEENAESVITFLHDSVSCLKDDHTKGVVLMKTAEMAELKGNLSAAGEDYQKAALLLTEPESYHATINAAVLLYEQGMYNEALSELMKIPDTLADTELVSKKMTLEAMTKYVMGEYEKAESLFEIILKKFNHSGYYFTALEYYLKLLKSLNQNDDYARVSEILNQYENSPEYLCSAGNKKVILFPRPQFLFENTPPLIRSTQAIDRTENQTTGQVAGQNNQSHENHNWQFIQTGSFTVKENAEYMILDLKKKGYNAFYIEKILNEQKYYSVLVKMQDNYESIDSFYEDLKNNGFNGFKVESANYPETQSE